MRKEENFNFGWEFSLSDLDKEPSDIWTSVNLPHDWLIYDTENLYRDGIGRYRKKFYVKKDADKVYLINFDGVYMDSNVYVNNQKTGEWRYGYSSFEFDITDQLLDGENEILVEIRHRSPNTRWYSGAGIFRDVVFKEVDKTHIITDGVYISAMSSDENDLSLPWNVTADVEIAGDSDDIILEHSIRLITPDEKNVYSISRLQEDSKDWVLNDCSKGDNCSICSHPCKLHGEVRISDFHTENITDFLKRENQIIYGKTDSEGRKYFDRTETYFGSDEVNIGTATKVNAKFRISFCINNPFVWDISMPNLYELTTLVKRNGEAVDMVKSVFGLRLIKFTPDKGCFLNGRHIKLYGVCEHHDLGALGSAFNTAAMRRKILKLKEMGVNAIRTSHNMPARKLLQLADEMGILINCEAFDMWRRVKTEFDYHNYFDEWYERDVESWIRRDRNHPSIIMWSIGNEIYDCHADEGGFELTKELRRNVEKHDYMFNAKATHGSNYMAWDGAQRCTENLVLAGYNYGEKIYSEHHEKHPEWMIYGSETASTVQSRGVYHFPLNVSVMADDDEQCSTLGNCTTSWGAESSEWVTRADRDAKFSQGQFIWTGFDYIGEPTPYHTKNSYFGAIDTAGFEKDVYYVYKAEWTDSDKAPFVHLYPYWDFNEGQMIDVRAASNLNSVELFVNGISKGIQKIDHIHGAELIKTWQVTYEKGQIEVVGYDYDGNIAARDAHFSFGNPIQISIADSYSNDDMMFLEISTIDNTGNAVENDNSRIWIYVEGNAELAGLDNGDSTDFENYKTNCRRLFNGKLLAMVRRTGSGEIKVRAEAIGLKGCEIIYDEKSVPVFHSSYDWVPDSEAVAESLTEKTVNDIMLQKNIERILENNRKYSKDIPIRKIDLKVNGSRILSPENKEVVVKAVIYPENASYSDIKWIPVNDYAVKSNLCEITPYNSEDGYFCNIKAKGDGHFRIRCMANNGSDVAKVISCIEFTCEGLGAAFLNPYEFIAGSLYTDSKGDIGNGNEKGVATSRDDDSYIGYENIDFGEFGSDEITIPIFTLDSQEYKIGIWEGRPYEEGSTLLCDGRYCKPSIWNVYQNETYRLKKRLKGVTSLYFTADAKYHIKGFVFNKADKAFSVLKASDCTRIYGDNYIIGPDSIDEIGNNVTIEFDGMDFGDRISNKLKIKGRSLTDKNSIHLKINDGVNSKIQLIEFKYSDSMVEQVFDIDDVSGNVQVSFVFLPGCRFDFEEFVFC